MTVKRTAQEQFGPVATDYATFSYHAAVPDLEPMLVVGEITGDERVLDIGSGPGHTALLFATQAREVIATDPTPAMLDQGRRLAEERGLSNVTFECTGAESLPFPEDSFDRVTSRQSAHHYGDIRKALGEVARVLKPGGLFVLIDTLSPENDEADLFLNAIELLRDSSHIRDYRVSEWREMFTEVGFTLEYKQSWDIPLGFTDWVTRSRTPQAEIDELRHVLATAPRAVRKRYSVDSECNWSVPAGLIVGRN